MVGSVFAFFRLGFKWLGGGVEYHAPIAHALEKRKARRAKKVD